MYDARKIKPAEGTLDIKRLEKDHADAAKHLAKRYDELTLRYAASFVLVRNDHINGVSIVYDIFLGAASVVSVLNSGDQLPKGSKRKTKSAKSKTANAISQARKICLLHMFFCNCDLCELFSISDEEFDLRYPHLKVKRYEPIDYIMSDLHYRYPNK